MRIILNLLFILFACIIVFCQSSNPALTREPIIDMHLHAHRYNSNGPGPVPFCYPISTVIPYMDARENGIEVFMKKMSNPDCKNPIWSAESDEALFNGIVKQLEKYNVVAIASGENDLALKWHRAAPNRILPSVGFHLRKRGFTVDSLRILIEEYGFIGLGEVTNQYHGIGVDDPGMDPFYALAQELDIPVGIHMGSGAPGSPMTISPHFEVQLSNPLHLEKVIKKYPHIRLYIMHYAEPFIDELIAMLYHYPQLYVDIGGIQLTYPKAYFYEYHLKKMVSAGFGKRIMYGSDAMVWPELIGKSIEIIEGAEFLSYAQKRDILYNNAARFLRIDNTGQNE